MHPWENSLPGTERHEDLVPCSGSLRPPRPGQPQRPSTLPARLDACAHTPQPQVCVPGMAAPEACSSSMKSLVHLHPADGSAGTGLCSKTLPTRLCASNSAIPLLFCSMGRTLTQGWLSPPGWAAFSQRALAGFFSLLVAILNCQVWVFLHPLRSHRHI